MTPHRLIETLGEFPKAKVLVVGDLMLDQYLWGRVDRISPEAPVPVVSVLRETIHPGGAANVAHNVLTLGGQPRLFGIIGDDDTGRSLLTELSGAGLKTDGILKDPSRPTIRKTRLIAHNQQVVRFDHEQRGPIGAQSEKALLGALEKAMAETDCVVVSDYAKGTVTPNLMRGLLKWSKRAGKKVLVDPKVQNQNLYKGVTLLTPNYQEAMQMAGMAHRRLGQDGLFRLGQTLLRKLNCEALLVTRGEEGISLFERGGKVTHAPTVARQVYDVTGAGDTVIAALAIALSIGADLPDAAQLANHAAGVVVGMVGTATVGLDQLRHALEVSPL